MAPVTYTRKSPAWQDGVDTVDAVAAERWEQLGADVAAWTGDLTGEAVLPTGGGLETVDTQATATGATTVNLANGNVHALTLSGSITLTLSGATGGSACSVTLIVTQGTGGQTVTWPGSVKWPGGTVPTMSTGAGDVDMIVLTTVNGGTTWYGGLVGADYS